MRFLGELSKATNVLKKSGPPKNSPTNTFVDKKINVHVNHEKVKTGDFRHISQIRFALRSKLCKILWHSFYWDQMQTFGPRPNNYFSKVKHPNGQARCKPTCRGTFGGLDLYVLSPLDLQ